MGEDHAQLFEVRDSVLGGRTTVVDASLGGRYVNLYAARFYEGPLSQPLPVLLRVRARVHAPSLLWTTAPATAAPSGLPRTPLGVVLSCDVESSAHTRGAWPAQEYPGDAQPLARTECAMYERLLGAEGVVLPAFRQVRVDTDVSTSRALADKEPALAPLLGFFDSVSIAAADQYAPRLPALN